MERIRMEMFYCDVEWDQLTLRNVQCQGLQRAGIPLKFGNRSDDRGALLKSTFTTDSTTRDLLYQFEGEVGITKRIQIAEWVALGNHRTVLSYINEGQFPVQGDFREHQSDISGNMLPILKRSFMTAFGRSKLDRTREELSTYLRYLEEFKLTPIDANDLSAWVAETYRQRLDEFPELMARVQEYQANVARILAQPIDNSPISTLKDLPLTS